MVRTLTVMTVDAFFASWKSLGRLPPLVESGRLQSRLLHGLQISKCWPWLFVDRPGPYVFANLLAQLRMCWRGLSCLFYVSNGSTSSRQEDVAFPALQKCMAVQVRCANDTHVHAFVRTAVIALHHLSWMRCDTLHPHHPLVCRYCKLSPDLERNSCTSAEEVRDYYHCLTKHVSGDACALLNQLWKQLAALSECSFQPCIAVVPSVHMNQPDFTPPASAISSKAAISCLVSWCFSVKQLLVRYLTTRVR